MNREKRLFFLIVTLAAIIVLVSFILRRPLEEKSFVVRNTPASVVTQTPTTVVSGILAGQRTWNGLQITAVNVEPDGWPLVKAQNRFNKPPLPGKRMLLITVRVRQVEGEKPVTISASDFKVVGERKTIYNTYSNETNCGVVPDELDGVVTKEHPISGAICVQVPQDENGFVLVYEPYVGNTPAVYISLPPNR